MADGEARIDYSKFTSSLQRLEEQHQHLVYDTDSQPDWVLEGTRESVIQRFEVCMDTCWKTLKRHLEYQLGLPNLPNSPNRILRLGAENLLLGGELEDWLEYIKIRNDTAHDYSKEKADVCLAIVVPFVRDAIVLHERLTGAKWQ